MAEAKLTVRISDLPQMRAVMAATYDLLECLGESLDAMPPGTQARVAPRVRRLREALATLRDWTIKHVPEQHDEEP